MGRMDVLAPAMDPSLALNRSKLLRLAESIKTRKRTPETTPSSRATVQCDPSLTNIEHLVFGPTYRPKAVPSLPSCNSQPASGDASVHRSHTTTTCRVGGRAEVKGGQSSDIGTPPNYHSLDRNHSSTISNKSTVTVVHVSFPSPMAPAAPVETTLKEKRQRTPLTRSRQKPPVQLQSTTKTSSNSVTVSCTPSVENQKNEQRKSGRIAKSTSATSGVVVGSCVSARVHSTGATMEIGSNSNESENNIVKVTNTSFTVRTSGCNASNVVAKNGRRPIIQPPPAKNSITPTFVRRPSSLKERSKDHFVSTRSDTDDGGSSCSSLSPGTVVLDSRSSLYFSVFDSSTGEEPSPLPQSQLTHVPISTSNIHTNNNNSITSSQQPISRKNVPPSLRRSLSSNITCLQRTSSRSLIPCSHGSFVPLKSPGAPSSSPAVPTPKSSHETAAKCPVTCVKALPLHTSSTTASTNSIPRSPERVYKALYTWYEPRRRLSFPSSSNRTTNDAGNTANITTISGAANNNNFTATTNATNNSYNAWSIAMSTGSCERSRVTTNLTNSGSDCPSPVPAFQSCIKRPPSGRTLTLPKSFTVPTSSFYVDSPIQTQLQNVPPSVKDSLLETTPREKKNPATETEREPLCPENCSFSATQDAVGTTFVSRGRSSLSKAARRIKASSSPPALTTSVTDLSASDGGLCRPWSQVYSECEAERILNVGPTAPLSCTNLALVPDLTKFTAGLSGRCTSLRAAGVARPQCNQVESVLLKFRKSFSMRFQKNQLRSHSPDIECSSPSASPLDSPLGGSTTNVAPDSVFRFGPIVWRSSKERKSKSKVEISPPTMVPAQLCSPSSSVTCSPVSARPKASSLRLERQKRPLSEMGTGFSSSVALSSPSRSSLREECRKDTRHSLSDLGGFDIKEVLKNHEHNKTSPCAFKMPPKKTLSRRTVSCQKSRLRRSVSQPMEMDKLTNLCSFSHIQGLSDQEDTANDSSNSSSDDEAVFHANKGSSHSYLRAKYVTYAEALWDHVTMDPEELPFKAGEQVAVLDCFHRSWWFGSLGVRVGWFPSSFVRPRVNQEDTVEDHVARMNDGISSPRNSKLGVSLLSNDQVRVNVIKEIIATERDFVQHLNDVVEGYLKQVRKRPDMFSEDRIATIFGNVEQLHAFQSAFLHKLEACIDWQNPEHSQLGSSFVAHKDGFQVYSEYCNNHPQAVNELQELFALPKYSHFFEACRLLQEMIDISLDGFLLTPVQKICKYPLQLAELLKYTRDDHPDYSHVNEALEAMREVAHYINERKRRMECLEKLAAWQLSVEYWEGPDLLDDSSELIHSGEVTKMTSSWSRDVTLFLFDHQLIVCKKDLLKRQTFCYKNRISMNSSQVVDIPDGRDTQSGLAVKSAWRVFCGARTKWYTFCAKTNEEKGQWMKAFHDERRRVSEDQQQGFVISEKAKSTAMRVVKSQQKRTKGKGIKEFPPRRSARLPAPHHPVLHAKMASLPHGVVLVTNKKKNSGWFSFGSSKKHKR